MGTAFYNRSPDLLIPSKLQMLRPLPEDSAQPRSAANPTVVGRHSWSQPRGQGPLVRACSCFWPSPSTQVGSDLSSGFLFSFFVQHLTSMLDLNPVLNPTTSCATLTSLLPLPLQGLCSTNSWLASSWKPLTVGMFSESTTVPPSVWPQVLSATWVWLLLHPPTGPWHGCLLYVSRNGKPRGLWTVEYPLLPTTGARFTARPGASPQAYLLASQSLLSMADILACSAAVHFPSCEWKLGII